jgi:hypothetical protein
VVKVGEQQEFIGILRLKTKSFVHGLNSRRRHELVEVSRGFAENSWQEDAYLEEWSIPERSKKGERYEFYNVLLIEWMRGIAYRRALGRVVKDVWEKEAQEMVDLVLG